ncbi:syntaxin-17 [Schistocerca americana]|uniref:syntaxin-17 n=1 Tax=Schistocerca americana TaxID=7009 RepID=UPI001F4FCA98|nr:syntaxin-17 [Schistocerca americana]XP_047115306.1 syntaxin-17 [Schistocerca piceifrons]
MGDTSPVTSKQTFKRVEIHLNRFNEVAIPHHVDLLKKHKLNIQKFHQAGDWDRVNQEQINATRLVKQLKALLSEIDALRLQVRDEDIQKFDRSVAVARQNALSAIEDYTDKKLSPIACSPRRFSSLDSSPEEETNVQDVFSGTAEFEVSIAEEELEKKRECLASYDALQSEVKNIHELFQDFSELVKEQGEDVEEVEKNVETTDKNVKEGTKFLARAARYKAAMYPVAGALIGTCLGGPVGLVAGLKFGGLAAIGCGAIGYTGGRFLKKKEEALAKSDIELPTVRSPPPTMKTSVSLPLITNRPGDLSS